MTNDDIIRMVRAGFSEDLILAAMLLQPAQFDRSVKALLELDRAGASDHVLTAVLDLDEIPRA